MNLIGMALLIALMIPIVALIVDSPIGRAIAGRLDREPPRTRPDTEELGDLQRRLEVLEGELDTLQHTVNRLHEENEFLQRLLEAHREQRPLPPGPA